jgi:hypothetical protein
MSTAVSHRRLPILSALAACLLVVLPAAAAPVPEDDPKPRTAEPTTRAVNDILSRAWKDNNLEPAPRTSDAAFLRRVTLDVLGRIPTPEEVRAFEGEQRADKRLRLVDRLLRSHEYAAYWAEVWTDWLLPPRLDPEQRERFVAWLRKHLAAAGSYKELVIKLLGATGKPADNPAVLFTLAYLGQPIPEKQRAAEGQFDLVPLTGRVGRFFLATDLHCVQCHDHPFTAELRQGSFWGVNAFFRQAERVGDGPADFLLRDNPELNKPGVVTYQRRNGRFATTPPAFLDGTGLLASEKRPRREIAALFVTGHPNFSRAVVNRLWAHFFGRDLTETGVVDDFGEHNPFVQPELMDRLARDFTAGGHDLRKLIGWLCASDAYQLRAAPAAPETAQLFPRMTVKRLGHRERLGALLTALRADVALTDRQRARLRADWLALAPLPAENCEAHLQIGPAALPEASAAVVRFLWTSPEVQAALAHPQGTVARALALKKPAAILDELCLTALGRPATAAEAARWLRQLAEKEQTDIRAAAWQDLLWAMLASSAFAANP